MRDFYVRAADIPTLFPSAVLPYLTDRRRDGYLAGAGFSYGYDWILKPNLNLEAELGVGYAHLWYKESDCIPCIKKFERKHKNYVGPTRAAVSLVYFF